MQFSANGELRFAATFFRDIHLGSHFHRQHWRRAGRLCLCSLGLLSLVFGSSGRTLVAQQSSSALSSDAAATLQRSITLLAHSANLLHDVTVNGTVVGQSQGSSQSTFELRLRGRDWLLKTTSSTGITVVSSVHGQGEITTNTGQHLALSSELVQDLHPHLFPLLDPFTWLQQDGYMVSSAGTVESDSASYSKINIDESAQTTSRANSAMPRPERISVLIDPSTSLIRELRLTPRRGYLHASSRIKLRLLYEDYSVISGVNVPTKISQYENDVLTRTFSITGVSVNRNLADSSFSVRQEGAR